MIRVFLVRHGESRSNAGSASAVPGESPLTERGWRQADVVAGALPDAPGLIVSSPFRRARETALATMARFPRARLEEWPVQEFTYLGRLHGRPLTRQDREPYATAYWERGDPHHAESGAESFAGFLGRAGALLDRLAAVEETAKENVVVFTHGMFMRAVAWTLLTGVRVPDAGQMGAFRAFGDRFQIRNGGVLELRVGGGAIALQGGATLHLPPPL